MPSTLRLIAIHVEESGDQGFVWVLTERSGPGWTELQTAEAAQPGYQQAMAQGLLALQALVDDLDIGPRRGDAEEPADEKEAPAEPTGPRPGSLFGFGPVR